MEKEYSLPREFTLRWLEALKSGIYKKTDSCLHNQGTGGFCCLGVACVIAGIAPEKLSDSWIGLTTQAENMEELATVPEELKEQVYGNSPLTEELMRVNDHSTRIDFQDVIDFIKQNVTLY